MLKKIRNTSLYRFAHRLQNSINYLSAKISPKKTYAQYQEDIATEILIGKVERFIDIGAYDGISCSNTFLFALKGAKGICFEPVRSNFKRLQALYLFNKKIQCYNCGISNAIGLLEIKNDGILSSIVSTEDKIHSKLVEKLINKDVKIERINTTTLNTILEKNKLFYNSDLTSIDVEGHELAVLQGIDFSKFKTKCFIVETHGENSSTKWVHQHYKEINSLLNQAGYIAALASRLNTFWISSQYKDEEKIQKILSTLTGYSIPA